MGLLDYVFRRVVAYETIKTIRTVESGSRRPPPSRRAEQQYLDVVGPHVRALERSFASFGSTGDKQAESKAILGQVQSFQKAMAALPAPPRFVESEAELNLALSIYQATMTDVVNSLDRGDVPPDAGERITTANGHLRSSSALLR